jgi:hypothetical protein
LKPLLQTGHTKASSSFEALAITILLCISFSGLWLSQVSSLVSLSLLKFLKEISAVLTVILAYFQVSFTPLTKESQQKVRSKNENVCLLLQLRLYNTSTAYLSAIIPNYLFKQQIE